MNQSIQRSIIPRMSVFMLALVLFLSGLVPNGLITESQAGILPITRTYIQATIDTSSWEILTGVVSWEAGVGGNQAESKRIGSTLLATLASSTKPFEVSSKISSIQKKEGGETTSQLVLCFPGKMGFSGINDNSTSVDTNRAQLIRNSLIYDLNAAFKFVYGTNGGYTPVGGTIDEQVAQFASDMQTFMGAIPSNGTSVNGARIYNAEEEDLAGITFPDEVTTVADYVKITKGSETRYFQYRMVKGYVNVRDCNNKLGLSKVESGDDATYIHWGQFVVEAFINYGSDEKLKVTATDVYDSKPGAIEKAVAALCSSVANWIVNALGLWNFDELVFNNGVRGTQNYVSGVFPSGWQTTIWAFFFMAEAAAMAMLLYAIIYNVGKKVMGTIDPVVRASAIEQIKYLFIVAISLGALPMALPLLMNVSAQITGILHDSMGGLTATNRFKTLAVNSGSLGSALTYLLYLGALIYFNVFYVFRALTVALLIILAPIFVAMMALSENKRYLAVSWFREFCANVFIQPLQALMLSFILLVPATGRNIESIIMAYVMIPLTNMLRQLFFGSAGSMADSIGQKGQRTGSRALMTLGGLGYSIARGGISSGISAMRGGSGTAEGGESGEACGGTNPQVSNPSNTTAPGSAGGAGGGTATAMPNPTAAPGGAGRDNKTAADGTTAGGDSTGPDGPAPVSPGTTTTKAGPLASQTRERMGSGFQAGPTQSAETGTEGGPVSPAGETRPADSTSGGDAVDNATSASQPSTSRLSAGRIVGGAALAVGAVALGSIGGGVDYMSKRFVGLSPGREGGLITQLGRAAGSRSGEMLHPESADQQRQGEEASAINNPNFGSADNPNYENISGGSNTDNPGVIGGRKGNLFEQDDDMAASSFAPFSDGGYTQAMEYEGSYNDSDSTNPYVRGFASRQEVSPDGSARYNIAQEDLRSAGINSIHKAGRGQSIVRYNMDNMGAADQNRMEQMINMWENGSAEEKTAMQAAGISDIQPVTKMIGGHEQVVGANVTYDNAVVKKNFGIDTTPQGTGGRGFEMTTVGEQAPAMVPDIAAYMESPQAALTTGQYRISQLSNGETPFTSQVSINAGGDVEITSQSPTEFVAISAMTGTDLGNETLTKNGYKVTIPQQDFIQAFPPDSSYATAGVRHAAAQRMPPEAAASVQPDMSMNQPIQITQNLGAKQVNYEAPAPVASQAAPIPFPDANKVNDRVQPRTQTRHSQQNRGSQERRDRYRSRGEG